MRKLILCVAAAIAALALTAPSALAQGEVTVTGGDWIELSSGPYNDEPFYPIYKNPGSSEITSSPYNYCFTEWEAWTESDATDGQVLTFDTWDTYDSRCDSYWRTCNWMNAADWDMRIYATGLSAPEFRVDLDLCMYHNLVEYTGTVTADLVMSGSTVTALKFNEAFLQNQSPPPGTGGIAVATGLHGEVTVDTPLQVEHTEQ